MITRFLHIKAAFCFIMLSACTHLYAQEVFCTDTLIADFRYFVRALEQTHPDPYSRYGGRPLFHRAVEECEKNMESAAISSSGQLATCINAFLVPLHDGHTSIANPDAKPSNNQAMLCAPIKFKALDDGLIVSAIDSQFNQFIGSRLMEAEGLETEVLYNQLATQYPSENKTGVYLNASWQVRSKASMMHCCGRELTDSLHICLMDAKNIKHNVALPFLTQDVLRGMHYENTDSKLILPTKNMGYSLLDSDGKTMYFRAVAMYSRDNIEYEYQNGMSTFANDLSYCYALNHSPQPENIEEAIAALPSFSEEFYKMLLEMKMHNSRNLIIDLRGNEGGWTPIIRPSLYLMWGNDYLQKNMGTSHSVLISPLYIEKMNTTLEEFNAANRTQYKYGDYVFIEIPDTPKAEDYIMSDMMMSCAKDKLLELKGKPVFTPENVFVVTDAKTFSAAFHYAFYLWKMGAKIVGTSSSQAPNTFMEQTPLYLPRTNLFASISNSIQMFLPADDPKAEMLVPDYLMTEEIYRQYAFDKNAEIMYILEKLCKS